MFKACETKFEGFPVVMPRTVKAMEEQLKRTKFGKSSVVPDADEIRETVDSSTKPIWRR